MSDRDPRDLLSAQVLVWAALLVPDGVGDGWPATPVDERLKLVNDVVLQVLPDGPAGMHVLDATIALHYRSYGTRLSTGLRGLAETIRDGHRSDTAAALVAESDPIGTTHNDLARLVQAAGRLDTATVPA